MTILISVGAACSVRVITNVWPSGVTDSGQYEIIAALGAGGMGEVYRARDTRLDRSVAIKI